MRKVRLPITGQERIDPRSLGGFKELPQAPGVYFLKGHAGTVEFVGRSEDLHDGLVEDLLSRFESSPELPEVVTDLSYVVTASPVEAELLELELIRRYRPELNRRRPQPPVFVHFEMSHPFPTVEVHQGYPELPTVGFGPFFDSDVVHRGLEVARRILGLRYCRTDPFPPPDYEQCARFGNFCSGPCRGTISSAVYRGRLERLILFLRGEDERMVEDLRRLHAALRDTRGGQPTAAAGEFDEGARALLELRRQVDVMSAPKKGSKLLVGVLGSTGRQTLVLYRRGCIVDRIRICPKRSSPEDLAERMRQALARHHGDPIGLIRPEDLRRAEIVRRHLSNPAPGERALTIRQPAGLVRELRDVLRRAKRPSAING